MSATVGLELDGEHAATRPRFTTTERHWFMALAILLVGLAVTAAAGDLEESLLGHKAARVFGRSSILFTSLMGIPHFLLGAAFAWTSFSMRSSFARGRWVVLGVMGFVLCLGYDRMLDWNGLLGTVALTGYFLIHDLRDQISFYLAVGDAAPGTDHRTISRILATMFVFGLGLVVALAAVLMIVGVPGYEEQRLKAFDRLGEFTWLVWALPAGLLVGPAWMIRRRLGPGTVGELRAFLHTHRPIAVVYAGVLLVMLTGLVTGHRAALIAIMHAATWYIFARWRLKQPASTPAAAAGPAADARPAPAMAVHAVPRAWTWNWVRRSSSGFTVAHFGVAFLLLAAGACSAWVFHVDGHAEGPLRAFLGQRSFEFWTIVHITTSFRPGG